MLLGVINYEETGGKIVQEKWTGGNKETCGKIVQEKWTMLLQ